MSDDNVEWFCRCVRHRIERVRAGNEHVAGIVRLSYEQLAKSRKLLEGEAPKIWHVRRKAGAVGGLAHP